MTKFDYAVPMKSNGVTAVGYILRVLAKFVLAIAVTIILGIELP